MKKVRVRWNAAKVAADMTRKGWVPKDLAADAQLAEITVRRFLDGQVQTTKTATKIAASLGFSVRRYVMRVQMVESREA